MRFTNFAAALAVFTTVAAGSLQAATLYVATSGNDANAGTLAAPFRTITKAASRVAAGDVVEVRGGTYNEIVKIASKGTAAARIAFRPYSGETVVIDGTGSAPDTNLVQLIGAQYVDFSGFDVRNATRIGICGYPATGVRILNNKVHGAYLNGIYFGSNSSDITIDGNDVYENVLHNSLHNMAGGWAQALSVANTTNATITNNRVYRNQGEGIDFILVDNGVARGNEVFDNFSVGIYLDNAQSITVDRNLVYNTGNTTYYRDGEPASGIGLANENYGGTPNPISNVTITNNIVVKMKWGFYYGAYDLGGGLKNVTLAHNTFYNGTYGAIWIDNDAHAGSVVQNNIFHQVGGRTVSDVAGAGVIYRTNLWYGGSAGGAAGAGDVIGDPEFVNAGGTRADDYKLLAGSRAIEGGFDVSALITRDYFGSTRSVGVDIGAHEYSLASHAIDAGVDGEAPTVPDRLRAAAVAMDAVSLAWRAAKDNVGVKGYEVYRDGVRIARGASTEWKDRSVVAGKTYRYQVAAVDAAGNASAKSAPLAVTTPSAPGRSRSVKK